MGVISLFRQSLNKVSGDQVSLDPRPIRLQLNARSPIVILDYNWWGWTFPKLCIACATERLENHSKGELNIHIKNILGEFQALLSSTAHVCNSSEQSVLSTDRFKSSAASMWTAIWWETISALYSVVCMVRNYESTYMHVPAIVLRYIILAALQIVLQLGIVIKICIDWT